MRVNTAMRRRKRCRRCNSQSMRFVAAHGGIPPKVGMAKEGQQRGIEHRADDEAAGGVEWVFIADHPFKVACRKLV